ncbi:33 kDa ribonucleoprotein, chloroplastic-like [Telopea speciosissima]|uniref:33 kDa ribonucleoprotein, chloroplastic-like n=1 Tax=Telopea speciosissima TaxID=54955 RepID=UPI001CC5B278|nr:33 kDa ribonucleoprotein, chloroplastic-like [Telopea speciosissima]
MERENRESPPLPTCLFSPMAAFAAIASTFSTSSSSFKFLSPLKPSPSIKLHCGFSARAFSLKSPLASLPLSNKKSRFELYSAVQEEITVEEKPEQTQEEQKEKLYVANLPYSLSAEDIKNIIGECGPVVDVEIIKQKDGRNKGFAFITMAAEEEARAVIDKFDSSELSGRIIRVEFAKSMKKPSPPPLASAPVGETPHKIYVSNLAWKARSSHLREFFSASFNPVSARVVFERPAGRSAGYGFVSFATREDAESAISALDGMELMGRPVRLKFSQKNADASGGEAEETGDVEEGQPEETDNVSEGQPEKP